MKSVDLNFATTPFRNNTPYLLGYGLGAGLLVAFTMFNGWAFLAYSHSRAELEADRKGKTQKIAALYEDAARIQELIKKQNLEQINSRASFTNGLLDRRRFSWTDLLNSLEEVQPYQVRLLSLLPRIQDKGIIIEARAVAKDLQAFSNFQQNLLNHPKFRRVYPGGFLKDTAGGEIIFNISFNYFPQGAPVDVKGMGPEEIVEAPGDSDTGPSVEEPVAPPPPGGGGRKAKQGGAANPPVNPGMNPKMAGVPNAPPVSQKLPVPGAPGANPYRPVPNPAQAQQVPTQPGASPNAASTGLDGYAQTQPGIAPNPAAEAQKKARWQGRGAMPGTGGVKPPAPPRAPTPAAVVPAAVPTPDPEPDSGDDGGNGDDDKGGDR